MEPFDPSYLNLEGVEPPPSPKRRIFGIVLWVGALSGGLAILVFMALHLAPAVGAAGGCGGG
jgi:hypothetical protein